MILLNQAEVRSFVCLKDNKKNEYTHTHIMQQTNIMLFIPHISHSN